MEAAFIPEVNDELDTQNFEKFDEVFKMFQSIAYSMFAIDLMLVTLINYSYFIFITFVV